MSFSSAPAVADLLPLIEKVSIRAHVIVDDVYR